MCDMRGCGYYTQRHSIASLYFFLVTLIANGYNCLSSENMAMRILILMHIENMKKILLIGLIILISSCSTPRPYKSGTKASDFPAHEILPERTINEIRTIIEGEPYNGFFMEESAFPAPYDINKKMKVLQYYFNKRVWIVFDETDKLVTYGDGLAKEAEYITYKSFYDFLVETKKILKSEAEKLSFQKYKELYGTSPIEDEYFLYKIMMLEKVDKGVIGATEAEYLLTTKSNELNERMQSREYQRSQLNIQSQQLTLAKKQLFLQLLHNSTKNNTYTPSYKSFNCNSYKIGNTINTSCY